CPFDPGIENPALVEIDDREQSQIAVCPSQRIDREIPQPVVLCYFPQSALAIARALNSGIPLDAERGFRTLVPQKGSTIQIYFDWQISENHSRRYGVQFLLRRSYCFDAK